MEIKGNSYALLHEASSISEQVLDQSNANEMDPQRFLQDLDIEYRVIHFEDDTDECNLCHLEKVDKIMTNVFDLGDQEKFSKKVTHFASRYGLSPRGSLIKSRKGTKHTVANLKGHTTRSLPRSYSHKIVK